MTLAKGSLGECSKSTRDVIVSLFITLGVCWPLNIALRAAGTTVFAWLLPPVTAILTILIMSCPWLSMQNVMLLFMFLVVQDGCRTPPSQSLYPLGLLGTCAVGCLAAVFIILLPNIKSALAIERVKKSLKQVEQDTEIMLNGVKAFMLDAGVSYERTRRDVSTIELAVDRITEDSDSLQGNVDAAQWELHFLWCKRDNDGLTDWVKVIRAQQGHNRMIRVAVMQRLLGEEASNGDEVLRRSKSTLSSRLQKSIDELVTSLIEAVKFCTYCAVAFTPAEAHEFCRREWDTDVIDDVKNQLVDSLKMARNSLSIALDEAERLLESSQDTKTSSFAFIIRRIQLCHGLVAFSEDLRTFLEKYDVNKQGPSSRSDPWYRKVLELFLQPWPRYSFEVYRLPFKAALGMFLASLFVAVPQMHEWAQPNAVWPALTVASVNLPSTGSSMVKAIDRLRGTLIASAYALMVVGMFGNDGTLTNNYVKVPALTLFTFAAIYMKNPARSYENTYAATSIGSILYGSIGYDYEVKKYIPDRIALIFTGVLIFSFVEFLVFPRSSRKLVQQNGLKFFSTVKDFLATASVAMDALSLYVPPSESKESSACDDWKLDEHDIEKGMLSNPIDGPLCVVVIETHARENLDALKADLSAVKKATSEARKELQAAIDEPSFGFSLKLNSTKYSGLVHMQHECEEQASLLVNIIERLQHYHIKDIAGENPFRDLQWPTTFSEIIGDASRQLQRCCLLLDEAFPDGYLRPQDDNSALALQAGEMFRNFEDVRLKILPQWSKKYHSFLRLRCSIKEVNESLSLELRVCLAIAESVILEICRYLQKAGNFVELIACEFPRFSSPDELFLSHSN